ncbi:MAG: polysaccharide deacetylase family protein [Lachnospiraceae bacterium]|nr:polysaccharide deacetylase family protein [Lachnospiraceae bacterium]
MKRMALAGGILALLLLIFILLLIRTRKKPADITAPEQTYTAEQASATTDTAATGNPDEAALSEGVPLENPATAVQQLLPEFEDGTGNAGLIPMSDWMVAATDHIGYVTDGQNGWYTPDLVNCYYNGWFTAEGATYHLDSSGLADFGWKLIGGKGCYFDENAVYQPDADPNRLLAFTFDDGPSQGMDEILALCEETGARVTFFMIGKQVEIGGAVIPHIIKDRCEVGNHTNTHTQQLKLSVEDSVADFRECDNQILAWSGGIESDAVRYPYGDFTPEHAAALDKPSIMWSVDSLDWDLLEAQPVIDTVLSQITEGDIILMHDRYDSTVEACRYLFPYLISQGYQLVTVKELAAAKGFELEPGKAYYGFCQNYIEENRVTG